ncbi:UPF0175 family protein [Fibrella sp. HMF5335]|uniref:UPF0175 family protein n=1 Tax=Fibrella rubiginis TaxID=2817060 RepID=A0A939GH18_9BACT|nr:UPF0175 family protein [Fibrella rubiginis]MBO0936318.1 UPF0175 family protein [Fibrella rubiginis]
MTITIPDELIEQAHLAPNELRTDLAAYLYEHRRLTLGQARRLAGMDLLTFQHELANRDIVIQFGVDDLEKDMKNLKMI